MPKIQTIPQKPSFDNSDGFFDRTSTETGKTNVYRKPQPKQRPEAKIQAQIIKYLESRGAVVLRTNSGVVTTQAGNMFRGNAAGTSDLTVLLDGKWIAIEVKSPGGKLTAKQKAYQAKIEAAGGYFIVADSVAAVRARLPL